MQNKQHTIISIVTYAVEKSPRNKDKNKIVANEYYEKKPHNETSKSITKMACVSKLILKSLMSILLYGMLLLNVLRHKSYS